MSEFNFPLSLSFAQYSFFFLSLSGLHSLFTSKNPMSLEKVLLWTIVDHIHKILSNSKLIVEIDENKIEWQNYYENFKNKKWKAWDWGFNVFTRKLC